MLAKFARQQRRHQVSRLASFPLKSIETLLLERGVSPEDMEDVKAALVGVSAVISAEDSLRSIFSRTQHYSQRYNDTTFAALYTALDHETCLAEISYHIGPSVVVGAPRYYQFVEMTYDGMSLELCGHEVKYPELVSQSDEGYPFCQAIALQAKTEKIDALHAPSARRRGGVCVPIFTISSVTKPEISQRLRFISDGTSLYHQML